MSSIEHLQQQLEERKQQYHLLSERIGLLRRANALETDVEERFRQKSNLEVLENNRDILNNEIVTLESKIGNFFETSKKYRSPKDYLEYQIVKSYEFLKGIYTSPATSRRSTGEEETLVSKYRSAIHL